MRNQKVLMMVESAIAVAIALILNKIGYSLPYGGSITLEMFPIFVIAFRWGVGAGFLTGAASGLLQLLINPYIVHPVQVILDYPLPYALLGIAGVFKNRLNNEKTMPIYLIAGVVIGSLIRFIVHIISGVIFFAEFAPEGISPVIYSLQYNATYLFPSMIICVIVTLLAWKKLNSHLNYNINHISK